MDRDRDFGKLICRYYSLKAKQRLDSNDLPALEESMEWIFF